ncbi:3213_t:CDS:2, partial [Acaulospora morrowiae]
CFQEMMYKSLEEKYAQLEKQIQGVMREAQAEITTLRTKVQALTKDMELEKRKTHDLAEQLQEKGRQFSKLQAMYDKLKRRSL